VTAGQNLSYTAVVTNNGPGGANAVTLTDSLPAGVNFISATLSDGTCKQSAGTVYCWIDYLAQGENSLVTLVVTPVSAGLISNTATVTAFETDPNATNNSFTTTTMVTPPVPEAGFYIIPNRRGRAAVIYLE
jgi:uncharacterized repeat protein (TIGR01451 family)